MSHWFFAVFRGLRARPRGGCNVDAPSSDILCIASIHRPGMKISSQGAIIAEQELSGVMSHWFLAVFRGFSAITFSFHVQSN